jgi:PERQ amino acid-rich with GYF domain-containing protein
MRRFPKSPTSETTRSTSPPQGSSTVGNNMQAASSDTINNNHTALNNSNGPTANTFSWSSVAAANNSTVSNRSLNDTYEKSETPGGSESALNPFKYSKDFMLKLYKPVGLPLEFERHEYVTSEEPLPPMALLTPTEQEQKVHLNSTIFEQDWLSGQQICLA